MCYSVCPSGFVIIIIIIIIIIFIFIIIGINISINKVVSPVLAFCRRAWFVLGLLSAALSLLEEGNISVLHVSMCGLQDRNS